MPTNRTRRTRTMKKPPIDPAEIYFLQHGTGEGGPPWDHLKWELLMRGKEEWKPIWKGVREEVIAAWIKKYPGTRCWAWWEYDAPRWDNDPFEGWWLHGTLPEPRQRLGGTGTPGYEVLNLVPSFKKGIPNSWIDQSQVEFYNGRSKDIHGKPIGTKYKEGDFKGVAIDPNDPPTFESEAAYLDRHGLLTPEEKRHLEKHPELLEPEEIE